MTYQPINQSVEPPLYSIYESKKRALIPKILSLLFLAFIFYLGVLVNISLLEFDANQETILKTGALLLLVVLIILGTILTYIKSKQPYLFFRNRITHGKETLHYLDITNTTPQANFIDHAFKTYSIQLGKSFILRHLSESIPLSNYIQQLVEYAKRNQ